MSKGMSDYHCPLCGASISLEIAAPMPDDGGVFSVASAPLPADVLALFPGYSGWFVDRLVCLALDEDGPDLTAQGVFGLEDQAEAWIHAKEDSLVVGLPLISLVLARLGVDNPAGHWEALKPEGALAAKGATVARLRGGAAMLLKAERVILNLVTHLSGVANLAKRYVDQLEGTGVRLLDTRKTSPGQRCLEKYAVRVAGACNHRMNLAEMLMLKDNHIDAAGSISLAVKALRDHYRPCPPVEVECRGLDEVREAVACAPERILLDNMGPELLRQALPLVPRSIEAEISGNVSLENIRELARSCPERPADFISVGRITHSAPVADFSMSMRPLKTT